MESIQELGNKLNHLYVQFAQAQDAIAFGLERQRYGYVDFINKEHLSRHSLVHFHKNIFSQSGQDGIIEEILKRLKINQGKFIEFGGWDGVHLSNCRYLALQSWSGIFIEADQTKFLELKENYKLNHNVTALNKFVNFVGENTIDKIAAEYDFLDLDLLVIDIDGLDYKVLEYLEMKPKVIVMEGGAIFSPCLQARIPDEIAQRNISQPLTVLHQIAKAKGYVPVCFFQDLYLVREDLSADFVSYADKAIELYADWYLGISEYQRDHLHSTYRSKDSVVGQMESGHFGKYEVNPLGYL